MLGLYMVNLNTDAALGWCEDNVEDHVGETPFPVEGIARMGDIAKGMLNAGLTVTYHGKKLNIDPEGTLVLITEESQP